MGTSVITDVLLLVVAVGLLALVVLAAHIASQARLLLVGPRPELPAEDRPPAGLGRLVPVGAGVDRESRQGITALELWLAAHRRG